MKREKPGTRRKRRAPSLASGPAATLARHRAQCRICRHPQREEIEREFLDWVPAREIAEIYKLADFRTVYRHAHAVDLFLARRGHVERVLDGIIERAGEAKITSGAVISAIKLIVELHSGGNWVYLKALRSLAGVASEGHGDETKERAGRNGYATRDDGGEDPDDDRDPLAGASPQLRRALNAAPVPSEQNTPRVLPVTVPAEETSTAAVAPPSIAKSSLAKAEPPKPPASPEPGTRREPDGPPQVAGMAWPWPKERSPFLRRRRWRGRPNGG